MWKGGGGIDAFKGNVLGLRKTIFRIEVVFEIDCRL